jgi:hypothetical protein
MTNKKKRTCFVIMPFDTKADVNNEIVNFDEIYEYIIKEVVRDRLNLDVLRCDEIRSPGWIHRDMLKHILEDDVAIVDITTLNANVFYELGVRHALRKSVTVLIRKKGSNIPFNIHGMRVIDYDLGLKGARQAQDDIEQFIRAGIEAGGIDSRVYDVFPDLRISFDKL